eukprot:SAG31_NODE_13387_length_873_cov_0.877261_1_plen_93_part_00
MTIAFFTDKIFRNADAQDAHDPLLPTALVSNRLAREGKWEFETQQTEVVQLESPRSADSAFKFKTLFTAAQGQQWYQEMQEQKETVARGQTK